MAVFYDVPAGKVFTIAGPAGVRVTASFEEPLIVDSLDELQDAAPTITDVSPPSCEVGAADFNLVISGDGFDASSIIVFAGYDEPTTLNGDGTLSTTVKPSLWANPDTVSVQVRNGPAFSAPLDFAFTDPGANTRKRKEHAEQDQDQQQESRHAQAGAKNKQADR